MDAPPPSNGRRSGRRRLEDAEQVPGWLWFFAGGRGKPPTGGQLREWKMRDRAWRERTEYKGELWRELWRTSMGAWGKKGRKRRKEDASGGVDGETEAGE